jgi:adenine-specific DNA-methyltransferase
MYPLFLMSWYFFYVDLNKRTGMKPYCELTFKRSNARLVHGDAQRCLQSLEAESVDLVITSPPYFVGKEYDKSRSVDDFLSEIRRIIPEINRCLKHGGSLCWQVGNHAYKGRMVPLDAIIATELQSHDSLFLRNRIIWTFGHGSHERRRFSGRHETILWYTKGHDYFFDLDASWVPQKYPGKRHYKGPNKGSLSGNPSGKNPGDVWEIGEVWQIPNVKANHIEKTSHPCQFPTALVRRLLVALSPKGGLVVDPYMGSGSTGVAALMEERNVLGVDINREYLEIARSRIESLIVGNPRIREDKPVRVPDPNESVAKRPAHFQCSPEAANE